MSETVAGFQRKKALLVWLGMDECLLFFVVYVQKVEHSCQMGLVHRSDPPPLKLPCLVASTEDSNERAARPLGFDNGQLLALLFTYMQNCRHTT